MLLETIISIVLLLLPLALSSPNHHFTKIYAFEDSFTDTGNTRSTTGPQSFTYVSNLPYDTTFFHHSTNRYSVAVLSSTSSPPNSFFPVCPPNVLEIPTFSHGVNFAIAGSTAIEHEFFVKNNIMLDITPQSLGMQLEWFDEYLLKKGCGEKGSCDEVLP